MPEKLKNLRKVPRFEGMMILEQRRALATGEVVPKD